MPDILDNLAKEMDKISEDEMKHEKKKKVKAAKTDEVSDVLTDSVMSNLLGKTAFHFPAVGDTTEGKVIEIGSSAIYLDLTPYGTGIVLGKEIKDGLGNGKLHIGDTVTATIMDLENEDGYIELSIREASYEKAWDDIESKRDTGENVATKILSANKGGLLVEVNGISGFLPVSQLSSKNYPRVEDGDKNKILNLLKKLVGQELEVRIIDANRETEKLIASEKAARSEKDREIFSALSVGDIVTGEICGVVDFGAFIKFAPNKASDIFEDRKLEGLVHISELAWQLIENPRDIVKAGDRVKAKIIGIENDKISLSIRALQKDPWSQIEEKYKVGDVVKGTVNKINHFGAFVYLDKDIHGLAHISEMSEAYPGKNLDEMIKPDEKYDWEILSIEPKDHRMGLVLAKKGRKVAESKEKENDANKEAKKVKVEKDKTKEKGKKPTKKTAVKKKKPAADKK